MRTVWKGSISFGLVNIPVRVVAATESHSVSFRQVHTRDTGRIRYRKVCEAEGEEVPGEEIGKAYETADGGLVPLTDADLASLPLPTTRTVDILGFVPLDSIDPYQLDRSYYLVADPGAAKPYVLLREALRRANKGGIAKVAMRGRETLALLRALNGQGRDVLGMHTLLWPDEIRPAAELAPEQVTVRDAELDMADTLMETLGSVEMSELRDEYREAVDALVSAKLSGTEPERPSEPAPAGAQVVDLMAALEDSVRSARKTRGAGAEEDGRDGSTSHPSSSTSSGRRKPGGSKAKGSGEKSAGEKGAGRRTPGGKATPRKEGARKKPAGRKDTGRKTDGKSDGRRAA